MTAITEDLLYWTARTFMLACTANSLTDGDVGRGFNPPRLSYKFTGVRDTYTWLYELYFRVTGNADAWRFTTHHLLLSLEELGLEPDDVWYEDQRLTVTALDATTRAKFCWSLVVSDEAYDKVPGSSKRAAANVATDEVDWCQTYRTRWREWRVAEMEPVAGVAADRVGGLVDELLRDFVLSELANRTIGLRLLAAQTGLECNTDSLEFERVPKARLLDYLLSRVVALSDGLNLPNEVPTWTVKFLKPCTSA